MAGCGVAAGAAVLYKLVGGTSCFTGTWANVTAGLPEVGSIKLGETAVRL